MDLQLHGKTALVTGASAGIGRAIAMALAKEGVKLCLAARRKNMLEQVAKEIADAGGFRPQVAAVDIISEDAIQGLAKQAALDLGHVDILINCAGGSRRVAYDAPEEQWWEAMRLSFMSRRQLTQVLLPSMMERKWGRIINITGPSEPLLLSAGNPAKAGLHAWAKALSRQIGKYGITINSIPPGKILSEQSRLKYSAEKQQDFSAREIPMGRFGEPEELAHLAVFLASPLASYITGTIIPVDGGLRRYAF